jgi:hypothetical protein
MLPRDHLFPELSNKDWVYSLKIGPSDIKIWVIIFIANHLNPPQVKSLAPFSSKFGKKAKLKSNLKHKGMDRVQVFGLKKIVDTC